MKGGWVLSHPLSSPWRPRLAWGDNLMKLFTFKGFVTSSKKQHYPLSSEGRGEIKNLFSVADRCVFRLPARVYCSGSSWRCWSYSAVIMLLFWTLQQLQFQLPLQIWSCFFFWPGLRQLSGGTESMFIKYHQEKLPSSVITFSMLYHKLSQILW